MSSVDAAIVFLPRFTTLAGATTFTTMPMDVSAHGGAQFQVWRGELRTNGGPTTPKFTVYFEESLDTETWVVGPAAPGPFVIAQNAVKFFSYSFRLRWFRLKVEIEGDDPIVTCWAEGLLRGGGGGLWANPTGQPTGAIDIGRGSNAAVWSVDAWLAWQRYATEARQWTLGSGPPPKAPSVPNPGEPKYVR